MKTIPAAVLSFGSIVALFSLPALAQVARQPLGQVQTQEVQTVDAATEVLREIMAIPAKSIPQSMFREAEGLVIVPKLLKGGFVVGVRHGKGVLVTKDDAGHWTGPTFVTVTGGSLGWQAGVQATDIVLVFATRKSLEGLRQGKFTIGAGASAAAGPVGREAAAATDARLRAEIYTYSRSRGLFAGVALDGSAIQIDSDATARYYAPLPDAAAAPGVPPPAPPSALRLLETIAGYASGSPSVTANPAAAAPLAAPAAAPGAAMAAAAVPSLRQELADSSLRLQTILDSKWQAYLALPAEVHDGSAAPSAAVLQAAVARYESVAADPQYQELARRSEFQQTQTLLKRYAATVAPQTRVPLPPPPQK